MQEGKFHDAQTSADELRHSGGWGGWPPKACAFSSRTPQHVHPENVFSERVALAIDRQRDMLALFPEMGCEYDPVYDAARALGSVPVDRHS